ncbi:AsnC family transcriptional regulator [Sphingorhabdus lutea]|uniref:AsnC family transcriptional regulator n=1 Tax=Sphingorhabdus lutea TaxID=1913578 RepID=A0A1L3JA26_9SPHN|nr:Lrp/AsnC family transcriptional regulator [Sphingorhabdus lutea]APG61968.1 AsnC family transcriptional regulator [Sphingorhabdus lutea]
MDRIDIRILEQLQRDSSLPINDLAEKVALSPSACHRRVKLLEKSGAISRYVARLGGGAIGMALDIFVEIRLTTQTAHAFATFEAAVQDIDEIMECHLMSGEADYRLRVAARDVADYDDIHRNRLAHLPLVAAMHSAFAIRAIKRWSGYPVRRLLEGRG